METKTKWIIFSICLLFVAVSSFLVYKFWTPIKSLFTGQSYYTKEEAQALYDKGLLDGANNSENYLSVIEQFRKEKVVLTEELSKLSSECEKQTKELDGLINELENCNQELSILKKNEIANLDKIAELEIDIEFLSNSIASKQKEIALLKKQNNDYLTSINYYENFITSLETETSAIATFIYDGKVIHIEVLTKGSCAEFNQPSDSEYLKFNYWMVNDIEVDLSNYPINTNTTFVANIEKSYDVKYYVDNELYVSKIILDGRGLPTIESPTKDGYNFIGWSLDGITIVDEDYLVSSNVDLVAIFEKIPWNVNYVVDDSIVHTEQVKTNQSPIGYTLNNNTDRKVFKGWSLDGVNVVDVSQQLINSDTTYIAIFDYYYSVNYMVNGIQEKSILIKNGDSILDYTPKANDNYQFAGWTLDGKTIVDITDIQVNSDVNVIALIRFNNYEVKFTKSQAKQNQIVDDGNIGYFNYTYSIDLSNYDFENDHPFDMSMSLAFSNGTTIHIDKLIFSSANSSHQQIYRYNYYPNDNDLDTHYDFTFIVTENSIQFSAYCYNNTALNDYDFTMTFNLILLNS